MSQPEVSFARPEVSFARPEVSFARTTNVIPNPTTIPSSDVKDKISAILVCKNIPGTESAKIGRSGEKYLATSELNPELVAQLKAGVQYKATGKVDGTCTLVMNGALHKRRDIKHGDGKKKQVIPSDWIQTGVEGGTVGHLIGFMPLDKGDKWHLDCHPHTPSGLDMLRVNALDLKPDGTGLSYTQLLLSDLEGKSVEVMGPKFQANPHHLKMHCIMRHGLIELKSFPDLSQYVNVSADSENDEQKNYPSDPLTAIKQWFEQSPQGPYLEGVVLHLDNGQMYKMHRHHLDMEWTPSQIQPLEQIPL